MTREVKKWKNLTNKKYCKETSGQLQNAIMFHLKRVHILDNRGENTRMRENRKCGRYLVETVRWKKKEDFNVEMPAEKY